MVVGESGLGKSTFINTIFLSDIYNKDHPGPSLRAKKTVEVCASSVRLQVCICQPLFNFILQEAGVSLKLTVIDTPGFGENIDNSDCWQPLVEYLDSRFDDYMAAEGRVSRSAGSISDKRVHACLYFIAPTGKLDQFILFALLHISFLRTSLTWYVFNKHLTYQPVIASIFPSYDAAIKTSITSSENIRPMYQICLL